MKVCSRCKKKQSMTAFAKHAKKRDGHGDWCRSCMADYHRERRMKDPNYYRAKDFRKLYNLTIDEYNQKLVEQENKCAICGQQPEGKPLAVDHCHETKHVRGLLCRECNIALGLFQDNPDTLEKAITYLVKSKELQIDTGNAGEAGVVHGPVRS